jgi:hypothetical protein
VEWPSDPTSDVGADTDAVTTDGSVIKGPSVLGLGALLAVFVALAVVVLTNPRAADNAPLDQAVALQDRPVSGATPASGRQGSESDDRGAGPGVTVRSESEPESSTASVGGNSLDQPKLPERGAFREAFVARLVADCDKLVDGPEPISAGLYREHGRCLNQSLERLDERCKLAAAVFYVLPGDEALNAACDIDETRFTDFRSSVRQSMVLRCDVQREQKEEQSHEAYYEYDRCLQQIDPDLDSTCYLVARAQFMDQIESVIRQACEIGDDVDLSAITG